VTPREALKIAEIESKKIGDEEIILEAKNDSNEHRAMMTSSKLWREDRKSEFDLAKTTVKLNNEKRAKLA
jgi:hypothetical protein